MRDFEKSAHCRTALKQSILFSFNKKTYRTKVRYRINRVDYMYSASRSAQQMLIREIYRYLGRYG